MQLIAWKDSSLKIDLLCVKWDVKPYTLTHSLAEAINAVAEDIDGLSRHRLSPHVVHFLV